MKLLVVLADPPQALAALVAVWLAYLVLKMLYNVSPLHPLSAIPGPKLAAASYIPEFWYDAVCLGRYTGRIRRMHEQYGPLVRINPDEVHCNDKNFSDEIYAAGGRKRNKTLHQSIAFGPTQDTTFATLNHDAHRARRVGVAKFFTRTMISRLGDDIVALTQKLCDKILSQRGQGEPFDLTIAYSNLAADVISGYCFGETYGLLQQPGLTDINVRGPTSALLKAMYLYRFIPYLASLIDYATSYIKLEYLSKNTALVFRTLKVDLPNTIQKTIQARKAGKTYERPTIIGALLDAELSAEEKTPERIVQEAFSVTGAGTETTSWALTVITYHLLSKPRILEILTKELKGVIADPQDLPPWTELEKLPYLSAVIQEGLRLSYGIASRSARVATEEDLVYEGQWKGKAVRHVIPRGWAVGMSSTISHHNETLFPDSYEFQPERWLDPERRKEREQGLLIFGRGSRGCPGMNLALCEIHLALAAMTLRVLPHMRLFETGEEDVRYDYDLLIPMPKLGSQGVRAVMV